MGFVVILSLIVPGLIYVIVQRKKPNPPDSKGSPRSGLIAGFLPLLASIAWALVFIVVYHGGYDFGGMQLMDAYKIGHYFTVPIVSPLFANLLWKKTARPLGKARLLLLGGFLISVIACENVPVGWTFTFILVPPAFAVFAVVFLFLRRKRDPH